MTEQARKYVAEFIGTFILILMGTMSIVAAQSTGAPAAIVVPFGFGLGYLAALHAVGEVSGGHFNPAVSLAMLLDKRIDTSTFIGYAISQVAGGVVGGVGLLLASSRDTVAATVTGGTSTKVMILSELYLTAIFVLVILAVTKSEKVGRAAFGAVAFVLAGLHFAGIPFSGASVNPARSLGPAIVGNEYGDIWIFVVFPLVGGLVAWVVHQFATTGKVETDMGHLTG